MAASASPAKASCHHHVTVCRTCAAPAAPCRTTAPQVTCRLRNCDFCEVLRVTRRHPSNSHHLSSFVVGISAMDYQLPTISPTQTQHLPPMTVCECLPPAGCCSCAPRQQPHPRPDNAQQHKPCTGWGKLVCLGRRKHQHHHRNLRQPTSVPSVPQPCTRCQ
jgi:hypothetical protein